MSIAASKNSSAKRDMRLINLAVSHVCSVTDINLSSRKGLALQKEALHQYSMGRNSQMDLVDALLVGVLKEKLRGEKNAKRNRKAELLALKRKRKAPE